MSATSKTSFFKRFLGRNRKSKQQFETTAEHDSVEDKRQQQLDNESILRLKEQGAKDASQRRKISAINARASEKEWDEEWEKAKAKNEIANLEKRLSNLKKRGGTKKKRRNIKRRRTKRRR